MARTLPAFCPVCNTRADSTVCPRCKTDLLDYLSVFYAPDMLWNKAAAAYGNKDYRDAYDKLAEAHYLRPTDNEILRQMVICAEKYGGIERAIRCLEKLKTGDDSPEVAAEYERLYAIYNNLLKEHREQAETKPRSAVNTSKKKKKKR